MTRHLDLTEVAVYSEDGRTSNIGTFHGWRQKDGAWLGDVMVYGDQGQYRDVIPADRLIPLIYCGRLASGEIRHSRDCLAQRTSQSATA